MWRDVTASRGTWKITFPRWERAFSAIPLNHIFHCCCKALRWSPFFKFARPENATLLGKCPEQERVSFESRRRTVNSFLLHRHCSLNYRQPWHVNRRRTMLASHGIGLNDPEKSALASQRQLRSVLPRFRSPRQAVGVDSRISNGPFGARSMTLPRDWKNRGRKHSWCISMNLSNYAKRLQPATLEQSSKIYYRWNRKKLKTLEIDFSIRFVFPKIIGACVDVIKFSTWISKNWNWYQLVLNRNLTEIGTSKRVWGFLKCQCWLRMPRWRRVRRAKMIQ